MVGDVLAQGSGSDLGSYLPMVFLLALGVLFAGVSATLGALVGPKRYNKAKYEAYECGIEPSPQPVVGGGRVPVAYYLTAMLFILFDIEMVFLYPFAVTADALGVFGVVEIVLFIATVGFAYAYVWRRGGLDWN
ncbi:NADH-quinone oxidoreductase subunit A [Actinosynnema sp. ALI-1.44]|uniref:NADH-quinone oxidoreductase subunit A n=1 Tax=Actinosynnema sp. ALI-1.44 TaxID=1933779 RepID=UPI00097BABC8|nr:NADH-quinone oxidoreductase subunit A [Actinosynnema sp. ALI-1.44]ONI73244.1 NADH-quinone oxidoreductase subunit A [Actinosynnema sp. ALI-1.44]